MSITNLRGNRTFLAAAHQDDDAFIVSRLRRHLEAGDEIFAAWTTSAQRKGAKYEQKRINESGKAMAFLGIQPDNCFFLRYPERETCMYMSEIIRDLKKLIRQIEPGRVYVPAYEGGHMDHDVTHYGVVRAMEELGYNAPIYEFPLYNAYKTVPPVPFKMRNLIPTIETERRVLSKDEYEFVKRYWSIYRSQHLRMALHMRVLGSMRKILGVEYIRELPVYDYSEPPCGVPIAYERFLRVTFGDFRNAVLLNKDKLH